MHRLENIVMFKQTQFKNAYIYIYVIYEPYVMLPWFVARIQIQNLNLGS